MPPAAKAPKKPQAPKKPSSRSKTGNDACSKAASNWQLAIRGKEPLDPETYKTLGKCRALARSKKQASDFGRTGKLSEQGQKALEGRLQKRFDQGKITQKSRAEELKILLAKRAERAKARAAEVPKDLSKEDYLALAMSRTLAQKRFGENQKTIAAQAGFPSLPSDDPKFLAMTAQQRIEVRKTQEYQDSVNNWQSKASKTQEEWGRKAIGARVISALGNVDKVTGLTQTNGGTSAILKNGTVLKITNFGENAQYGGYQIMPPRGSGERKAIIQKRWDERKAQRASGQAKPAETVARLAPTASGKAVLRPAREPKPGLTDTKRLIGQVKAKEKARAETQSGVRTVKTSELKADPERFQYKLNTNATGVTDQFKETKVWNKELAGVVQVWKDPANGQTYVVNGHHRYELASRLGVKNLNVQYIQAASAAEARQKGALTNIAEGRGTSLDAGKFLRDLKTDNPEAIFQQRGISLSEKTASEGLALRNLAAPIWSKVVNEQTPLSRAVAIGKSKLREEDQIQLFNKAEKGQWTSGKTLEFGKELKRAPLVKTSSDNLFGDEEFINVAEQRAALADRFQTRMKTDANLFGKVGRSRNAGRLEQVGSNRIDVTSSQEQAKQAQNAVDMFNIERNYGLVSRTLDKYATGIAGGQKLDKVYPQFERQVSKQLDNLLNKEIRDKRAAELRAMNPADRRKLAKRRTARV